MGPFGVLEVDPLADDATGLEAIGKVVQIDSLVDASLQKFVTVHSVVYNHFNLR